jgi:hypothetical protein
MIDILSPLIETAHVFEVALEGTKANGTLHCEACLASLLYLSHTPADTDGKPMDAVLAKMKVMPFQVA